MPSVKEALQTLIKERAYRKGEYKLSSGKTSEHYVNCKPVTLSGSGLALISVFLLENIEVNQKIDIILNDSCLGKDPIIV